MIQVFDPHPDHRWSWATLTGPDAQDFLHRITSVNVRDMKLGQGARGCLMTPQGKLVSVFTLWNYAPESYGFEFEAGLEDKWKSALFTGIDKFTFSEKMTLVDVSATQDFKSRWIFTSENEAASLLSKLGVPALSAMQTVAGPGETRISHHGTRDFGKVWLGIWGMEKKLGAFLEAHLKSAKSASLQEIESWRIMAMSPRIDRELTPATIPLEAGLADAIAPNKGCYPGQEVIEKIVSLGSPSRRLVLIEGQGSVQMTGQLSVMKLLSVANPPAEIGELTSVFNDGSCFFGLGFVRKIHAKENFPIQFNVQLNDQTHALTGTITRIAPYA